MYNLEEFKREYEKAEKLLKKFKKTSDKLVENSGEYFNEKDKKYLENGYRLARAFLYKVYVDFGFDMDEEEYTNKVNSSKN